MLISFFQFGYRAPLSLRPHQRTNTATSTRLAFGGSDPAVSPHWQYTYTIHILPFIDLYPSSPPADYSSRLELANGKESEHARASILVPVWKARSEGLRPDWVANLVRNRGASYRSAELTRMPLSPPSATYISTSNLRRMGFFTPFPVPSLRPPSIIPLSAPNQFIPHLIACLYPLLNDLGSLNDFILLHDNEDRRISVDRSQVEGTNFRRAIAPAFSTRNAFVGSKVCFPQQFFRHKAVVNT